MLLGIPPMHPRNFGQNAGAASTGSSTSGERSVLLWAPRSAARPLEADARGLCSILNGLEACVPRRSAAGEAQGAGGLSLSSPLTVAECSRTTGPGRPVLAI